MVLLRSVKQDVRLTTDFSREAVASRGLPWPLVASRGLLCVLYLCACFGCFASLVFLALLDFNALLDLLLVLLDACLVCFSCLYWLFCSFCCVYVACVICVALHPLPVCVCFFACLHCFRCLLSLLICIGLPFTIWKTNFPGLRLGYLLKHQA